MSLVQLPYPGYIKSRHLDNQARVIDSGRCSGEEGLETSSPQRASEQSYRARTYTATWRNTRTAELHTLTSHEPVPTPTSAPFAADHRQQIGLVGT